MEEREKGGVTIVVRQDILRGSVGITELRVIPREDQQVREDRLREEQVSVGHVEGCV